MNEETSARATPAGNSAFRSALRRFGFFLIMAGWMGGFTFYAEVVIPVAAHVLGTERTVGFITQQVTGWLNLIGTAALLYCLWNLRVERRGLPAPLRSWLAWTWLAMALCQAGLFVTHHFLDGLLQPAGRTIHDFDRFQVLHQMYLVFATVQWLAALLHIWKTLDAWRQVPFPGNRGERTLAEG